MDANCVEVIEVEKDYKSLTAKINIPKGTFLGDYRGKITKERGQHTVQIGLDSHIASVGFVIYSNHSCSPNAQFIYHARNNANKEELPDDQILSWYLVSSRDILEGEPITNDYTLTEYSMAVPFDCLCKSPYCLGRVQGFRFLPKEEKEKRFPFASPVVQKLFEIESQSL